MTIYEELGVTRVINASGPFTRVGGSLMPSEVLAAMAEASRAFVSIDRLLQKAGEHIAELIGVEAGFITSGAAAGLAVATAACMAGEDPTRAVQLPDTTGLRDEVIMLRSHRIQYDQVIRVAGARVVDVGFTDFTPRDHLQAAITDRTAAVVYVAKREPVSGSLPLEQVVDAAHGADVPVIVDAADELPPVSNLRSFLDRGADLAVFSGGKDISGPQSSGLVLGRRDFIRACAVHACPNHGIGRAMKAGKEEIAGLLKAVELYVEQDFDEEMKHWEEQRDYLVSELSHLPDVRVGVYKALPGEPGSFYLPAAHVALDEEELGTTQEEVVQELWAGNPAIAVDSRPTGIVLHAQMLKQGEEKAIVSQLRRILGRGQ